MQDEESPIDLIPWNIDDCWLGIILLGVWLNVIIAFRALAHFQILDANLLAYPGLSEAVLVGIVVFISIFRERASWRDLGLRDFPASKLLWAIGLFILQAGLMFGLFLFLDTIGFLPSDNSSQPIHDEALSWRSGAELVSSTLLTPFAEELFFRGFLLTGLAYKYGWGIAAISSSILFAVLHLHFHPFHFLNLLTFGLITSLMYKRTGSLWPSIIFHGLHNALVNLL